MMLYLVGEAFTGRLIELETEVDSLKQQVVKQQTAVSPPGTSKAPSGTPEPAVPPVLTSPVTPLTQESKAKTQVETFRLTLAKLKQDLFEQEKQQKAWSLKTTALAEEKLTASPKGREKIRLQADTLYKGVEAALRKKSSLSTSWYALTGTYATVLPSALTYFAAKEAESIRLEADDALDLLDDRLEQLMVDLEFLRGRLAALRAI
jgi:hypothetical protein